MKVEDNTILIVPKKLKNRVIYDVRNNNDLLDVKFMDILEFNKNYYFDYDNKTIYYLMKKYNLVYDVALEYIKNLYYLKDIDYGNEKLSRLREIYDDLRCNGLLIYNDMFRNYISNKNILVYGFDYLDKLERETFNGLDNACVMCNGMGEYRHKCVYEFRSIEEEVNFVCIKIISLLNEGVDINNIRLLNVSAEYNNTLVKLFKFYNIPLDIGNRVSIYSTNIGEYFIDNISCDIDGLLDDIKGEFRLDRGYNRDVYNKIIGVINNYTWVSSYLDVKSMIEYDFKNTYVYRDSYFNVVSLDDVRDNIFDDDKYYFLLGFNQGSIPFVYRDEGYITDNIVDDVYVDSTVYRNKMERESVIGALSRIRNLVVTYKLSSLSGEYTISNLNEVLRWEVVRDFKDEYGYSNVYNKIRLGIMIDNLVKYNSFDSDLVRLYNSYSQFGYLSYNNSFTGISSEKLRGYLGGRLLLSYSTIDNYNRCGFRYYLNNILKVNMSEDNFMTVLGSLFHYMLQIGFVDGVDIDFEYDKYIRELGMDFSFKEKFFLEKLKGEVRFIIDTIKMQMEECSLDNCLYEERVYVDKSVDEKVKITFMGVIDKLLYKDVLDGEVVSIIDYKTGNPNINLNTCVYGIEMQLPIYLYLASNIDRFNNVTFAGFYLQKVLNNEIVRDNVHSYLELKRNNLKLQGYSNQDVGILSMFDKSYMDSVVIRGMKTTSKGFSSYARVIDNDKLDKIVSVVDGVIDKDVRDILDARFDINPKRIGDYNYGCEFCKFRDICFRSNNDIVGLREYKNLEFLEEVR